MKKSIFSKILFIIYLFSFSSCSFKTTIKGEFLLENTFKCTKEFENGEQCLEEERWFLFASTLTTHSNEKYELVLNYKNGDIKEFNGDYKIYVGDVGHSGKGYFIINEKPIDLVFQASYFLIFELPTILNPPGCESIRTLYFQRW